MRKIILLLVISVAVTACVNLAKFPDYPDAKINKESLGLLNNSDNKFCGISSSKKDCI